MAIKTDMTPEIKRDQAEIDEQINATDKARDTGRSKYPGQTYEDGVRNAIDWLLGDAEEPPMS